MNELLVVSGLGLLIIFCTALEIILRKPKPATKINFHVEDADCEISILIEAANMDDAVKAFFIVENSHKQERVEMNLSTAPSIH